jgi:hypothetical protein
MRMVHTRKKDGCLINDILEIGRKIKKVGLEFNTMVMGINTKVVGKRIKEPDKVPIGHMRGRISNLHISNEKIECVENIQVIG